MSASGYSSSLWSVLKADLQDRLGGNKSRANARWGLLKSIPGRGKLIWVRAGSSYESVLLASEIAGALHQKRLDVRIVFTFEQDYPHVYLPRFKDLERIAYGFGCCDLPSVVKRVLERWNPFGVISVYDLPGANLSKQCQALGLHTVNVHTAHPMIECEAWYPHLLEDSPSASPKYQQEASDLFSLLVNPQVEPSLKPALGANSEQRIFFFGKLAPTAVQSLLSLWQDSRSWRKDYLCVSTDESFGQGSATFKSVISCSGLPYQYLSTWNRSPLPPETLLIADQPRWVSALASAADQTVISGKNPLEFWQVLAAGGTLRLTSTGEKWSKLLKNMGNYSFSWESWLAQNSNHISPMDRKTQDAQRQVFWQYRRAAQAVLDELLQRVFDW